MEHYDRKDYYYVAVQAKEIATKLGHNMIRDGYYSDEYLGKEYEYESLRITYYNNYNSSHIYIYINGTKALDYDFLTQEIEYINGKWTDLINAIHYQIPSIVYKRKLVEEEHKRKIDELKSLEPYFKECVIYDKNKDFLIILNNNLNEYGIRVSKYEYNDLYLNKVTGDYEESAVPTIIFEIYNNDTLVAKFNGSQFNIFPNIDYYAESFTCGDWIDTFKYFVTETIEEEKERTQSELDSNALELLRKFKV